MNNTTVRLITAGVAVPVLIWVFYRGGWPFIITIELAIALGIGEYYRIAGERALSPNRMLGTAGALLIGAAAVAGDPGRMMLVLTLVTLVIIANRLRSLDLANTITGAATTLFGVIYIGWLLAHAMLLRFPPHATPTRDLGFFFIVMAIAGTFLADGGAYFTGRAYGKNKLLPFISPGKTVEGAIGGVVGGALGVLLTKLAFDWFILDQPSGMPVIHCLILGPFLVAATIAGDLAESMMKRDAGVKDSGTIIPGHGGIMDRLDSILFALPVTYYYLKIFVYGDGF